MIDIYRGARGSFLHCLYWKRDENGEFNSDELIYKKKPTGQFVAKLLPSKTTEKENIGGAFRVQYDEITISTTDIVDIDNDDLLKVNGVKWIAVSVNTNVSVANTEYSKNPSKETIIKLRKGK